MPTLWGEMDRGAISNTAKDPRTEWNVRLGHFLYVSVDHKAGTVKLCATVQIGGQKPFIACRCVVFG